MNRRIWRWALLVAGITALLVSQAAYGDIYTEAETVNSGMFGQPPSTKTVKTYYSSMGMRVDNGEGVMIMDYTTFDMYTLNPADKTYTKMNIKEMSAQMGGMASKMAERMKFSETDETKTVAGYKCRRYTMDMGMGTTEFWVSKDVKYIDELLAIGEKAAKALEDNPMMQQMNSSNILAKSGGFPVQTVNNIMGGTTTTTLTKIEKQKFSKDLFTVSADYKLKEMPKFPGRMPGGQ